MATVRKKKKVEDAAINTWNPSRTTQRFLAGLGVLIAFLGLVSYIISFRPQAATNCQVPVISIRTIQDSMSEAASRTAVFRVSKSGGDAVQVSLHYEGSAKLGGDYSTDRTSSISLPTGASYDDIAITPTNDSAVEGSETIIATLDANPALYTLNNRDATSLLIDDETQTPSANPIPIPGNSGGNSGGQIPIPRQSWYNQSLSTVIRLGLKRLLAPPVEAAGLCDTGSIRINAKADSSSKPPTTFPHPSVVGNYQIVDSNGRSIGQGSGVPTVGKSTDTKVSLASTTENNLPIGRYTVRFFTTGYTIVGQNEVTVIVPKDGTVEANFTLRAEAQPGELVVVVAVKKNTFRWQTPQDPPTPGDGSGVVGKPNLVYEFNMERDTQNRSHLPGIGQAKVIFDCDADPNDPKKSDPSKQFQTSTNGDGITAPPITQAMVTAKCGKDYPLGGLRATLVYVDGQKLPAQGPTYDYYFGVSNTNPQLSNVTPIRDDPNDPSHPYKPFDHDRFIGIRPTVQGRAIDKEGRGVANQRICYLDKNPYTDQQPAPTLQKIINLSPTDQMCNSDYSYNVKTDSEGWFFFHTISWGQYVRHGSDITFLAAKKPGNGWHQYKIISNNGWQLNGNGGTGNTKSCSIPCNDRTNRIVRAAEQIYQEKKDRGDTGNLYCAYVVTWIMQQADILNDCYSTVTLLRQALVGAGAKHVATRVAKEAYRESRQGAQDQAKPGDIIVWPRDRNGHGHIGVVVEVSGSSVTVVHNSSSKRAVVRRDITEPRGPNISVEILRFPCATR